MKVRVATTNPSVSEVVNGVVFAPFAADGIVGMFSEEVTEEQAASFLKHADFKKVSLKEKDLAALEKLIEKNRLQAISNGVVVQQIVEKIKGLEKTNQALLKENSDLREVAEELIEEANAKRK